MSSNGEEEIDPTRLIVEEEEESEEDHELNQQLATAAINRKQQQDETKAAWKSQLEALEMERQAQQQDQQQNQQQEPEQAAVDPNEPLHQDRAVVDLEILDAALAEQQQEQQQRVVLEQQRKQQKEQAEQTTTSTHAEETPRKKHVTIDLTAEAPPGPQQTRKEAAKEKKITTPSTTALQELGLEEDDKLFAVTCLFCKHILIVITKRAEVPLAGNLAICVCAHCEEQEEDQHDEKATVLPQDVVEDWHHGKSVRRHLQLRLRIRNPYRILTWQQARDHVDMNTDRLMEGILINDKGLYGLLWTCNGVPQGFFR